MADVEVLPQEKDPIWRLENLYLIRTKDARVSKMKLNRVQKMLLGKIRGGVMSGRELEHHVLKFRQGGVSTFFLLLHLDRTIFNPNISTGVLADLKENLDYLFEIIRFAHESMPDGIRPALGKDSASMLSFPGSGSKIFVSLSIKSTTLHGLHVSEYAHMEEEDVDRTLFACAPGGWITTETTADRRNFYHRRWRAIPRGLKTFLPWPLQEEYRIPGAGKPDAGYPAITPTEEELRLVRAIERDYGIRMDDAQLRYRRDFKSKNRLAAQEMAEDEESCFIQSGGAFFDGRKIGALVKESAEARPVRQGPGWVMWEERQRGHVYVAGADPANDGSGADPDWSVLAIVCATCRQTAFRYRTRAGVREFYKVCSEWGRRYNNALLAPEENGHGAAVIMGLVEDGYPNLYARNRGTRVAGDIKTVKYGYKTDSHSKTLVLDRLKEFLEGEPGSGEDDFEPQIRWLDTEFLEETFNVTEDGGKIQARAPYHDDMVMAYAIAMQMYSLVRPKMSTGASGIITGGTMDSYREFKT